MFRDDAQGERLNTVEELLDHISGPAAPLLQQTLSALRARDPMTAATDYVETFDMRRRCTMYLTYWTAGDTRNRGREMHAFAQAYRITALKNCLNDLRRQELCLTLRCLSASYLE